MSVRTYGHKRGAVTVYYPKMLFSAPRNVTLPSKADLRADMPPVYDQGTLGSCTANAIGAALQHSMIKTKKSSFVPSRLYIYYNERKKEGTIPIDCGATISSGIEVIKKLGLCPETNKDTKITTSSCWPYDIKKFRNQPSAACYNFGKSNKALVTNRIAQEINQLKQALLAGFSVTVGICVYESFESSAVAATGLVPMPNKTESFLGGHAVLIVGYDDNIVAGGNTGHFIVRNSWGTSWGDKGYCYIPYQYILRQDLACEFYTINQIAFRY